MSRLGNPLFNEVLVPMERKDDWNQRLARSTTASTPTACCTPSSRSCSRSSTRARSRTWRRSCASGKPRADLAAILLTGIPLGVVSPNFQNFTGTTQADLLRLNMAIPPSSTPNNLGVVGGDLAGFPNGRRIADDVVNDRAEGDRGRDVPAHRPDLRARRRGRRRSTRASRAARTDQAAKGTENYLPAFPYLGTPHSGYEVPAA